jgi:uncharacterized phage infection (PIP) family protein YhgE
MTTVNDISDILRIIREQPEWADALRGALLGQELLELPQRFAEFVQAVDKRFAALESDVAELKAGQARLEGTIGTMQDAIGNMRGAIGTMQGAIGNIQGTIGTMQGAIGTMQGTIGNIQGTIYEQKIGNNIASIVRQHLGIRSVRILKGYKTSDEMTFHDLIDEAEDQGVISEQERIDAGNTDIVLQGQRHPDLSTMYVVLEVSVTVAENDINRAAARAGILQKATGEATIPAVIGAHMDDIRQELAQGRDVTLITIGE